MILKKLSLVFMVTMLLTTHSYANNNDDYQVKAAYLYQFFKYIQWSDKGTAESNAETKVNTIGIFSHQNFNDEFKSIEKNKNPTFTVKVQFIKNITDAISCCNMIYFGPNTENELQQFSEYNLNGVVVVADDALTNGELSMIQLHKKGTKLKFIINARNTESAGVIFSSRLLRVALRIND